MLEHITVGDEELKQLASQRALHVKEALLTTGQVESERLFLIEAGTAQAATNGVPLSRVDLTIK